MKFKVGDVVRANESIRAKTDTRTWTITAIERREGVTVMALKSNSDEHILPGIFDQHLELVVPRYITEFDDEWKKLTNE